MTTPSRSSPPTTPDPGISSRGASPTTQFGPASRGSPASNPYWILQRLSSGIRSSPHHLPRAFFGPGSGTPRPAGCLVQCDPAPFPGFVTSIELLVLLLLAVMAVPEVCSWLGRPALSYPLFVCFGLVVGGLLQPDVATMVREVGEIGFVLLLFEVGMEIEIPLWRELGPPLRFLLR